MPAARSERSSLAIAAPVSLSSPVKGSSSTITRLACASCSASEARRAIPPESSPGILAPSRAQSSPTASTSRRASPPAPPTGRALPESASATATLPPTLSESTSVVVWNSAPTRSRGGTSARHRTSTAMPSAARREGAVRPASVPLIVVFPAPVPPRRWTQSPSRSSRRSTSFANEQLARSTLRATKVTSGAAMLASLDRANFCRGGRRLRPHRISGALAARAEARRTTISTALPHLRASRAPAAQTSRP